MSKWTEHVRSFATAHQLTYGCALSDPKCSAEYHSKNPKPIKTKKPTKKELGAAEAMLGLSTPQEKKAKKAKKPTKKALKAELGKLLSTPSFVGADEPKASPFKGKSTVIVPQESHAFGLTGGALVSAPDGSLIYPLTVDHCLRLLKRSCP